MLLIYCEFFDNIDCQEEENPAVSFWPLHKCYELYFLILKVYLRVFVDINGQS